ncbi:MAG: ABC transporter ATP-binding protein [bacterium]|nr:ABC transporter ATP-binding protein [bacterium]
MIEIKNLSFGYNKNSLLFDDLNFEVKPGRIYGVLGKNAAGKTSLLHLMIGLLSSYKGTITAFDETPKKRTPSFLNQIYYLPERFYVPKVSVKEYVKLHRPFYSSFAMEIFDDCINSFGVDMSQKISSLSFGEQKKVLISFALATCCSVILLDEPTNGLDIPGKSIFNKLILKYVSEEQSVLIATHQVKDLQNIIDPIIILDRGKVVINSSRELIDDRIAFYFSRKFVEDENIIYSERTPGGHLVIAERDKFDGEEIKFELSPFFKSVSKNTAIYQEILSDEGENNE